MSQTLNFKSYIRVFCLVICIFTITNALEPEPRSKKEPCTDYPSCQLISTKMFESYCTRIALKNMCPTYCDEKCKKQTNYVTSLLETSTTSSEVLTEKPTKAVEKIESTTTKTSSTTEPKAAVKQMEAEDLEEGENDDEKNELTDENIQEETTTTTTITSTRKVNKNKGTKKTSSKQKSTTLKFTTTTTTDEPSNLDNTSYEYSDENQEEATTIAKSTTTTIPTSTTTQSTTTTPTTTTSTTKTTQKTTTTDKTRTTTAKPIKQNATKRLRKTKKPKKTKQPSVDQNKSQTTSTNSTKRPTLPSYLTTKPLKMKKPDATIFVPLFEAGFVQRIIPTSCREECDFSKATLCKQEDCDKNAAWCAVSNDIPKEQIEILFNYTTDIYMFEIQGRAKTNETVTSFLFQYLNDAGILISNIYQTEDKNATKINKFMFDPPLRTNYIRLTPIEYENAISMRFEIYSKGILYNPSNEDNQIIGEEAN